MCEHKDTWELLTWHQAFIEMVSGYRVRHTRTGKFYEFSDGGVRNYLGEGGDGLVPLPCSKDDAYRRVCMPEPASSCVLCGIGDTYVEAYWSAMTLCGELRLLNYKNEVLHSSLDGCAGMTGRYAVPVNPTCLRLYQSDPDTFEYPDEQREAEVWGKLLSGMVCVVDWSGDTGAQALCRVGPVHCLPSKEMFGDTGFEYMVVVDNPGGSAHQYVVRRARLATKKEFGLYQCEGGKLIHMDGTMEVLGDQL